MPCVHAAFKLSMHAICSSLAASVRGRDAWPSQTAVHATCLPEAHQLLLGASAVLAGTNST